MLGLWETWGQLSKASTVRGEETRAVAQARKLSVVREVLCSETLFAARHRPHSWSSEGLGRPLSCLQGQQGVSLSKEVQGRAPSGCRRASAQWGFIRELAGLSESLSILESSLSRRASNLPSSTFPSCGCRPRILSCVHPAFPKTPYKVEDSVKPTEQQLWNELENKWGCGWSKEKEPLKAAKAGAMRTPGPSL